ncbi:MAG: hypothetical protein ABEI52_06335, partial [Halobacteriaceae archaeon]
MQIELTVRSYQYDDQPWHIFLKSPSGTYTKISENVNWDLVNDGVSGSSGETQTVNIPFSKLLSLEPGTEYQIKLGADRSNDLYELGTLTINGESDTSEVIKDGDFSAGYVHWNTFFNQLDCPTYNYYGSCDSNDGINDYDLSTTCNLYTCDYSAHIKAYSLCGTGGISQWVSVPDDAETISFRAKASGISGNDDFIGLKWGDGTTIAEVNSSSWTKYNDLQIQLSNSDSYQCGNDGTMELWIDDLQFRTTSELYTYNLVSVTPAVSADTANDEYTVTSDNDVTATVAIRSSASQSKTQQLDLSLGTTSVDSAWAHVSAGGTENLEFTIGQF